MITTRNALAPLVALLVFFSSPSLAGGPDSRSTPPAWNWGSGKMQVEFDIDRSSCTNIKIPVGGATVSSSDSGDRCPVNTVGHGYYFGKKKQTIYGDPIYSSYRYCTTRIIPYRPVQSDCPNDWNDRDRNPTTGTYYDTYKNKSTYKYYYEWDPYYGKPIRTTIYRYRKRTGWEEDTRYTVDPNRIYMRCCEMDVR